MTIDVTDALFPLGRVLATPAVVEAIAGHGLVADHTLVPYLARHVRGDWGDLDNEDQATNDWAVAFGDERILAHYR